MKNIYIIIKNPKKNEGKKMDRKEQGRVEGQKLLKIQKNSKKFKIFRKFKINKFRKLVNVAAHSQCSWENDSQL